jgi:hypothetical protein
MTGLAIAGGGTAWAAGVFGQGYLNGWEVMSADGETVCSDPYIWPATHEIECD